MQARAIATILLLAASGGCRGPAYYADKPPAEIAEMVQVHLTDLDPGEAAYSAPAITGDRSYRLAGRKDLDSGRTTHVLRVEESASGESRFLNFARDAAAARVCALTGARLTAGPEGGPAPAAKFELADQSASCYPTEDCDRYPRVVVEKYRDESGQTHKRKVRRWVRHCRDLWRCRSQRIYQIALGDQPLRRAGLRPEGLGVELGWSCGRWGERPDRLELPAAYLEGYLLAVDGDPYASRPAAATR